MLCFCNTVRTYSHANKATLLMLLRTVLWRWVVYFFIPKILASVGFLFPPLIYLFSYINSVGPRTIFQCGNDHIYWKQKVTDLLLRSKRLQLCGLFDMSIVVLKVCCLRSECEMSNAYANKELARLCISQYVHAANLRCSVWKERQEK